LKNPNWTKEGIGSKIVSLLSQAWGGGGKKQTQYVDQTTVKKREKQEITSDLTSVEGDSTLRKGGLNSMQSVGCKKENGGRQDNVCI